MKLQKQLSAAIAVLSALSMTACNKVKNTEDKPSSEISTTAADTVSADTATTTEPMTTFTQAAVTTPKIKKQDFYSLYEAEDAKLSSDLKISFERDDYSGDGYVRDFTDKSSIIFDVKASSDQHYDLSFSIASDSVTDCHLTLDGNVISTFRTQEGGGFTYITVGGVYMKKGTSKLELTVSGGTIDIDYLKITDSEVHSKANTKTSAETSVKKSASSAKELKKFLSDNYGKYIITGQYVSDSTDKEIDLVYRTTGKLPVIRFSDMDISEGTDDIGAIKAWHEKGGISCVSWYWSAPSKKSGVRTEDTDFSLEKAVTAEDIASLSQDKIKSRVKKKKISEECRLLIEDIDAMAEKLKGLGDTPVMFRPLPEGCGDWYWWGADGADAYKWLWNLIYKRMTEYHKLDNLLWVWNGQNKDSLVDNFDIAAADLFISGGKDYGERFSEAYAAIQSYAGKDKIIGITECGSVPDTDTAFRDKAVWSFFGLMGGEYVSDSKGEYSEQYTSKDALIKAYNSEGTLTLDEIKE